MTGLTAPAGTTVEVTITPSNGATPPHVRVNGVACTSTEAAAAGEDGAGAGAVTVAVTLGGDAVQHAMPVGPGALPHLPWYAS